ncbi:uncharacterized protein METZ01_LOCUS333557, partial [marine metagenome]
MQSAKSTQEKPTSFDRLDESIQVNQALYDRLHESLVNEIVTTVEDEEKVQHYKDQQKDPVWGYLIKLKQFYQANDLFRYALWSLGLMILST